MWDSQGDIIARTVLRVRNDDIVVSGKIDDHSVVVLVTPKSITIQGKIDNHSNVTLRAGGNIVIGTQGGDDDNKIDGNSSVVAHARGDITLGSFVHNASADFQSHGNIKISGNRELVPIDAEVVRTASFGVERRSPFARLVPVTRPLDLHHVSAEVAQQHRAQRSREYTGQVQNLHSSKHLVPISGVCSSR